MQAMYMIVIVSQKKATGKGEQTGFVFQLINEYK